MVIHQCNICFCEFGKKSTLINHQNKKNPCKLKEENKIQLNPEINKIHPNSSKINPNSSKMDENTVTNLINKTDDNYSDNISSDNISNISKKSDDNCCDYCGKKFSNNANLKKHVKFNCKVKKLDEEKKENIFNILLEKEKFEKELILKKFEEFQNKMEIILINNENLQKTNKFLQKKLNKFEDKLEEQNKKYDNKMKQIINKNINKNSNNTNNYTQNNIIIPSDKLVEFGKEDLTKIDLKDLFQIIKDPRLTGTTIFIEMLKLIHFNPKLPQFQNVYLTDKNREKFMTWNGKKWGLNADCLQKILSQFEDWKLLNEDDIEEAGKTGNYKKVVDKFIKFFDKCFFDDNDENKEDIKRNENFRESIEELIKEFLYNNRNIPIDNFEKIRNDLLINN